MDSRRAGRGFTSYAGLWMLMSLGLEMRNNSSSGLRPSSGSSTSQRQPQLLAFIVENNFTFTICYVTCECVLLIYSDYDYDSTMILTLTT